MAEINRSVSSPRNSISSLSRIKKAKERIKSKSETTFALNVIEFLKKTLSEPNIYSSLFVRKSTSSNFLQKINLSSKLTRDAAESNSLSFNPNKGQCSSTKSLLESARDASIGNISNSMPINLDKMTKNVFSSASSSSFFNKKNAKNDELTSNLNNNRTHNLNNANEANKDASKGGQSHVNFATKENVSLNVFKNEYEGDEEEEEEEVLVSDWIESGATKLGIQFERF